MFQKVVDRPVNIGHFNRVLWISLADSDPRLQCVFLGSPGVSRGSTSKMPLTVSKGVSKGVSKRHTR